MFLPENILNYFDLTNFEEETTGKTILNSLPEKILHIHLDENDASHRDDEGYKSNGFTEECLIYDYPARGRKSILHVRRRRWITPDGHNEVVNYDDLLTAQGTKLSRDFAAFLKGTIG